MATDPRETRRASHRLAERIEFRALLVLTYPLFLAVAVANRLAPKRAHAAATRFAPRGSVFAEARAVAHSTLPYAFMG